MSKGQTVPVSLRLHNEDEGFNNFVSDLRRRQKVSSLLSDLLYFYFKDESVQEQLSEFLLKENEFYANVSTQFQTLVDTHKKPVTNMSGVPLEQLIGLISDITQSTKPQTALIQQINPMGYGQAHQPYPQGQYVQQVPPQQLQHMGYNYPEQPNVTEKPPVQPPQRLEDEQSVTVPEQAKPQQQASTGVTAQQAPTPEPVKQTIHEQPVSAPVGLFDDTEEEQEQEQEGAPVKPASLSRLMKSIKK